MIGGIDWYHEELARLRAEQDRVEARSRIGYQIRLRLRQLLRLLVGHCGRRHYV